MPAGRRTPDSERLLFGRSSVGLWIVGVDGEGASRIARGESSPWSFGISPVWSPDGRSIVFALRTEKPGEQPDLLDVYTVDPVGLEQRRLTSDGESVPLGWSPDGDKILFLRTVHDADDPKVSWSEVWVMDADGGRQTRLPLNRRGLDVLTADW